MKVSFTAGVIEMPLTKRQFDLGIDEEGENLMRQIYMLLSEHVDLAYSQAELQQSILGDYIPIIAQALEAPKFKRAVEVLVGIGAVDKRDVAGTDYYAFLQEFDTGTWLSTKLAPPPSPIPAPPNS
ncbi:MAG: hypothetical protein BZY80_04330 [SAR202 cluster bacterium Io17-Chloro-G2]|nr:MAG: hypothetical protein BZY80_04330 [SAR202 cluster bacterium Io17-Chloro-G2]